MNFSRNILLGLLCLLTVQTFGQLTTNTSQSPSGLVQNVLLGPGVTVSNIMYSGSPMAIGEFNATNTNLGITQGIVMTSGTVVNNGNGPQGPNNQAGCGMDNSAGGSTQLTNLAGNQTFNAAILEFDFIPFSDTVRFKYVFGSDEYPEFAPPNNSGYNDVFGFFISGPGISGLQNIARLPNGGIVSINNVNAITNSQYYTFNGDGNSMPYNSSGNYIQYDGFTKVLEAVSRVQCGQTYHLIMAIADVGDGQWDSGIFLEANSLSSETPITVTHSISQQMYSGHPDRMAEGCVSGTITLTRAANLNTTLTIPIQTLGTATNGVDYTAIPNSVTFLPGQTEVTINFDAIYDNLPEGLESLKILIMLSDPCDNVTPEVISLFIQDVEEVKVNINNPVIACPGQNTVLNATVTGGVYPYTYLWNTGATTSSIGVAPSASGNYYVAVNDVCSGTTGYDTVLVNVPIYQPLMVTTNDSITEICPFIPHTLYANASGGSGLYVYIWKVGNTVVGTADTLVAKPEGTTTYIIRVSDNCGSIAYDTVTYTVTSPPLVVNVSPKVNICPGESAYLFATASGGYGNYHYLWLHNGATTTGVWVQPSQATYYEVQVSDDCQTFSESGFPQVIVIKPHADFSISSETLTEGLPITFQNTSINAYGYDWYFSDGGYSSLTHPNHVFEEPGTYYVTLVAKDDKGCVDSITKQIIIKEGYYIYIPNTFIPNGDRYNEYFSGSFVGIKWVKITVYNRWGEPVFFSEDMDFKWDGTFHGKRVQDGTYTWKLNYRPNREIEQMMTGHINVLH